MNLLHLALKDLRLLFRDKMGAFFVIGFPVLLGLFFGVIFKGPDSSSGGSGKISIAVVDLDNSPQSTKFLDELRKNEGLRLEIDENEAARKSVRLGQRSAMIVIPTGFGQKAGLLWEEQPEIQIGVDPSRVAESAMLEGMVMQAVATLIGDRFQQPTMFLPSVTQARESLKGNQEVDLATKLVMGTFLNQVEQMIEAADRVQASNQATGDGGGFEINFANVKRVDVTREVNPSSVSGQLQKIRSDWDISFPQAMMWGIMGCVAGFSMSIARERSRGTLVRLRAAPLSKTQVLLGKALACFLACLLVMLMMTTLGVVLGMQPLSYLKLAVAGLVTSFCFVGIMMTMSVLGKTEESVAGTGWAANIVMAMFGGGMVPVMFMPAFVQSLSRFSPIYWALRVVEGAIWRDFSWAEMLPAILVLIAIGLIGTIVGANILYRRDD
ncbi:MAG: ABC transporter permease [Pirellulaceae bacterium]|nr:ABC transporter permease [Pirellulaceae bacterium]